MNNALYSASLMCGNFLNMSADLKVLAANGIKSIHVDVMDGRFVPNIAFGFDAINQMKNLSFQKNIHLMMDTPSLAISSIRQNKKDTFLFHVECKENPESLIDLIGDTAKKGLVINPDTDPATILPYLTKIDHVMLMCIIPGFYGQQFIENSYDKAEIVVEMVQKYNPQLTIGVDGGIGKEQILRFYDIGINHFVLGTRALYNQNSLSSNIKKLPNLSNNTVSIMRFSSGSKKSE